MVAEDFLECGAQDRCVMFEGCDVDAMKYAAICCPRCGCDFRDLSPAVGQGRRGGVEVIQHPRHGANRAGERTDQIDDFESRDVDEGHTVLLCAQISGASED